MDSDKVYTIKDIARYAGVAPSTVSRVLSNKPNRVNITEKTKEKIWAAVKEFNYTPNVNARRLAGCRVNTIALVMPSRVDTAVDVFSDVFLRKLLLGLERVMIERKCRLMMVFKHDSYVADREYLKIFNEGSISGMLIWGARTDDRYIRELYNMPVLQVGGYYEQSPLMNYIGHDIEQGSYMVARNVLKQGRRKIACVWGPPYSSISLEHRGGVMRAMDEAGLRPEMEFSMESFGRAEGEKSMELALTSGNNPDAALFCTSTEAMGAENAMRKHGMTSSDIILGGGYGGEADAPHIATYIPDAVNMGKTGAETLLGMIEGKITPPVRTILPVLIAPQRG